METARTTEAESLFLEKARLSDLVELLRARGYRVVGPVIHDGTVTYEEIQSAGELPAALRDEQSPGRYRLVEGAEGDRFGIVNGAGSLKSWFFAPFEPLLEIRRRGKDFEAQEVVPAGARLAFVGVRACDLAAVAVQDRIFLDGNFPDAHYAARRSGTFIVAVDCTRAAATCFCASMSTGPAAQSGFDLALTEFDDGFVVRIGSEEGAEIARSLGSGVAEPERLDRAQAAVAACAQAQQRRIEPEGLRELLYAAAERPHWEEVAKRCLSCGNCTMVCPTCFCHGVVDVTELSGESTRRVRQWDSCFSYDHAQIHGKNFRPHLRDRYRQWLTHKLAAWIDQYGTSGCVGCGRCITWCPTGIDLTAEVAALRADANAGEKR